MSPVTFELHDGIAKVGFDDGKANAINGPWLTALDQAIDRAEAERAPIVMVGRAGFFSGGLDLKTLPTLPPEGLQQVLRQLASVMLRLFTYRRPVVAAATGHAIAGGMIVLLAADQRYAAEGPFRIGLNETAIGLTLPRFAVEMARVQIPVLSLRRVIAEGELFYPAAALELGLVDAVVPPDAVIEKAISRARVLATLPESSYGDNKLALRAEAAERGREAFEREVTTFMSFFVKR